MTATGLRRVALLAATTPMLEQCRASLKDYATVDQHSLASAEAQRWDSLLLALPRRLEDAVESFVQVRTKLPATPLILLGADLDADTAVELIKCGADDYLSLPIDPGALARKVRRVVGTFEGPALDHPGLAALQRAQGRIRNRRHCHRVELSEDLSLHAVIRSESGPVSARVVNLSIKTEGWLGGMLLALSADARQRLPAGIPAEGNPLPLTVMLADGGEPIPIRARVVLGGLRSSSDGLELVAVQYQTRGPFDETRLRDIWLDAQRSRRRRTEAGSAPGFTKTRARRSRAAGGK